MRKLVLVLFCTFSLSALAQKIALIPYQIVGDRSSSEFFTKIESHIKKSVEKKAKMIVFPELVGFDLLVSGEKKTLAKRLDQLSSQFDLISQKISELAKKYKTYILGGSYSHKVNQKTLNSTIIANPKGEITLQDKIYLTPWESRQQWSNGEEIKIINSPFGRFVNLICHDAEFPDISEKLKAMNLDFIIVTSQTDTKFGHNRVVRTSKARAIENFIYVLHVGANSKAGAGWHTYRGSADLFTPQIKAFENMEKSTKVGEEKALIVELDLKKLRKQKLNSKNIFPTRDIKNRKQKIIIKQDINI